MHLRPRGAGGEDGQTSRKPALSPPLTRLETAQSAAAERAEAAAIGCVRRPSDGRGPGGTRGRHVRSRCRCSLYSAIHINSRSWLRSSSTREPSDPPLKVVFRFNDRPPGSSPRTPWQNKRFIASKGETEWRPGEVASKGRAASKRARKLFKPSRPPSQTSTRRGSSRGTHPEDMGSAPPARGALRALCDPGDRPTRQRFVLR